MTMLINIFLLDFSIKNIDIIKQDNVINIDLSYRSIEGIRYKPILLQDKEKIKYYRCLSQNSGNYLFII